MTDQQRLSRYADSALFPFATAALAIAIFIADTVTRVDIAVSVLYVTVVLMSTRSVVLVGLGCVDLTALSFFLSPPGGPYIEGVINRWVSITVIGLTNFLALQSQSAEARLREQASLLDLTHDVVVTRTLDDVITSWNRGAEDLYGWSRAEAVGKVAHELLGSPVSPDQARAELLHVGRFEGEFVNKRRDGSRAAGRRNRTGTGGRQLSW